MSSSPEYDRIRRDLAAIAVGLEDARCAVLSLFSSDFNRTHPTHLKVMLLALRDLSALSQEILDQVEALEMDQVKTLEIDHMALDGPDGLFAEPPPLPQSETQPESLCEPEADKDPEALEE